MTPVIPSEFPRGCEEPIPGYRLIELLGKGGYGEVWKASAPGGVSKAIKLIYDKDPTHGARELQALNRIKDVRHPFLLSIERIEQLPGMLAIVTELADRNLQQHFQTYRAQGMPGIPQQELLTLLRGVAEVLDFIYQEFALQHLDIKAANLLLFGKYLKLGDFGLVTNIFDRKSAQAPAMTPAYAAPEIFNDQPSGTSDQYSLAIVYQEMLTGNLPFNEVTAARLAYQHLHDSPNLRSLPTGQRAIIARALSKDPRQRFASCTDLIDELTTACRVPARREAAQFQQPSVSSAAVPKATGRPMESASRDFPASRSPVPPAPVPTHSVPQKNFAVESVVTDSQDALAPTVVIGLGGSAAQALRQLQKRFADRLDDCPVAAFPILSIDTDPATLGQNRQGDPFLRTVITPLLSSDEYRAQGHLHRRWLSRRWLFNVPRSLTTDGLRPYGRLALLTHADSVKDELRSAIQSALNATPSVNIFGRSVAGPPRILLVSSISGGTGSGMLLDLAYLARAELQRAGVPSDAVEALLLHSTPEGPDRGKALLNAVATLRELAHYSTETKCYPGEPLLDVPAFHGDNRTFRDVKLMHLGDELDTQEWQRGLDDAAEILFFNLTAPRNRNVADQPQSSEPTVDVIQVRQVAGYAGTFIPRLVQEICRDVVRKWCGTAADPSVSNGASPSATQLIQTLLKYDEQHQSQRFLDSAAGKMQAIGIDLKQLVSRAREMLTQELGMSERDYLRRIFAKANGVAEAAPPDHSLVSLVLSLQDRAIGLDFGERMSSGAQNSLFDLLRSRLGTQAMQLSSKLMKCLYDLVDDPSAGAEPARVIAEACRSYLDEMLADLARKVHAIHQAQIESRVKLASSDGREEPVQGLGWWTSRPPKTNQALEHRLVEHGLVCLEELVLVCVRMQLQSVTAQASAVLDKLTCFCRELQQFERRFDSAASANANEDWQEPIGIDSQLHQLLCKHRERLTEELLARIEADVLPGPKKLQRFLSPGGTLDQDLWEPMQMLGRKVVLFSKRRALQILMRRGRGGTTDAYLDESLISLLAEPMSLSNDKREVIQTVMVPSETSAKRLKDRLTQAGHAVTMVTSPGGNIVVYREAPQRTVFDLVQQITWQHAELIQLADSLLSRMDVAWKPLSPASFESSPVCALLHAQTSRNPVVTGTVCLTDVETVQDEI